MARVKGRDLVEIVKRSLQLARINQRLVPRKATPQVIHLVVGPLAVVVFCGSCDPVKPRRVIFGGFFQKHEALIALTLRNEPFAQGERGLKLEHRRHRVRLHDAYELLQVFAHLLDHSVYKSSALLDGPQERHGVLEPAGVVHIGQNGRPLEAHPAIRRNDDSLGMGEKDGPPGKGAVANDIIVELGHQKEPQCVILLVHDDRLAQEALALAPLDVVGKNNEL